jgi:hypothetical protein
VGRETGNPGQHCAASLQSRRRAKSFDPDLQPWERQPEEPDEAYQMFLTYWDMTTRNMALFDAEQYAARE